MKQIVIIVIAAVLGASIYSSIYTVAESEQVVIVQMGKPMGKAVTDPGLHIKEPFWQDARRFEKRWLEWDGDANQITTLDKRYIFIDVFARWRIADPMVFIESVQTQDAAQSRLDDIIDSAIRNVVANHNLIEAIRSTNRQFEEADEEAMLTGKQEEDEPAGDEEAAADKPTEEPKAEAVARDGAAGDADAGPGDESPEQAFTPRQPSQHDSLLTTAEDVKNISFKQSLYAIEYGRETLTQLIMEKASEKAAQLGIELKDVQFKRINYIESVQAKVFDRMISERKRVAEAFRSQGRGKSAEILGQTEKELKEIRSGAYKTAQEIKGRADAEAAAIYAEAYQKDPEFYTFVKTLESYGQTVDENTWLLLSTEADYAQILRKMRKAGP